MYNNYCTHSVSIVISSTWWQQYNYCKNCEKDQHFFYLWEVLTVR